MACFSNACAEPAKHRGLLIESEDLAEMEQVRAFDRSLFERPLGAVSLQGCSPPRIGASDSVIAGQVGRVGGPTGEHQREVRGGRPSAASALQQLRAEAAKRAEAFSGPTRLRKWVLREAAGHGAVHDVRRSHVQGGVVSHSGEQTCLDAVVHSRVPVSINHTGCRALTDLPRNKSDEELRVVASRGGFVGIYFMPFLNPTGHARAADVVEHIVHAVDVCGEDHVGIGTDGPVTAIDDLDAYRARLAEHVAQRQEAGVSAAGERADTLPFVVDLRGVDQFRELIRLLEQRGYSAGRIEKIMGRNFVDYAERVWAA